jgi:hypothetical protein
MHGKVFTPLDKVSFIPHWRNGNRVIGIFDTAGEV